MTVLRRGKHPLSIRGLLSGWDMQADVPSGEQIETAMSILVVSGLAEVHSSWGMRLMPRAISDLLAGRELNRVPLSLPASIFAPAREDYLDAGRRKAEERPRHRWWWPNPFRRPINDAAGRGSRPLSLRTLWRLRPVCDVVDYGVLSKRSFRGPFAGAENRRIAERQGVTGGELPAEAAQVPRNFREAPAGGLGADAAHLFNRKKRGEQANGRLGADSE